MKGLVLKDLLVLKTSMKGIVLFIVLFGVIGSIGGNNFMTMFASVYAGILPMTCMAYDERSKFNRFAMVLPVKKSCIVLSKYATGILLIIVATIVSMIMVAVTAPENIAESLISCIIVPLIYQTFIMPIMFKFGTEKSRLIMMAMFVVPVVLVMFAAEYGLLDKVMINLSALNGAVFVAGLISAIVIMYIASVFISLAICKNKEW